MTDLRPGIIPLDDPAAHDAARVGAKAAGLAALRSAGLRAPPGLVVLPDAELPDADGWLPLLATLSPRASLLSVRSSAVGEDGATSSYAGLHVTRLGVSASDVGRAVAEVRASAASPAARAYRDRLAAAGPPLMAVLIQPMVNARVSGVAFGADPVTGARDALIVEAVCGLGQSLVSGRAAPFRARLRDGPRGWTILSTEPGSQTVGEFLSASGVETRAVDGDAGALLGAPALAAVATAVRAAERARGAPQDVEWALDDNGLVLLQSRPITTLSVGVPPASASEGPWLESATQVGGTLWTRANFREVLPEVPSQALLSVWGQADRAIRRYYEEVGLRILGDGPISRLIQGRLYFNATRMAAIFSSLGMPDTGFELAMGHGLPRRAGGDPFSIRWSAVRRNIVPMLRLLWRQRNPAAAMRRYAREMEAVLARAEALDPSAESEDALLRLLRPTSALTEGFIRAMSAVVGNLLSDQLRIAWLVRGRVDSVEGFVGCMTAPGTKTVTTQQGIDFLELARSAQDPACRSYFASARTPFVDFRAAMAGTRFLRDFERFLDRYGHRGVYESDPAQPRFRDDPSYLLANIAEAVRRGDVPSPDALERGRLSAAKSSWLRFTNRLSAWERVLPWRAVLVRMLLRRVKRSAAMRERIRSDGVRGTAACRRLLLALGGRWAAGGRLERPEDIFLLLFDEIRRASDAPMFAASLRALVQARRREREGLEAIEMPNLLWESPDGRTTAVRPPTPSLAGGMRGLAVSGGRVCGPAAVVRSPAEFSRMRAGSVLVAPATDPAWSPLFALARGVVVEMGGLLSHGSILAREFGIPTVVNIPGVCDAVRDGDRLEVDGWRGTVRRVDAETLPAQQGPKRA